MIENTLYYEHQDYCLVADMKRPLQLVFSGEHQTYLLG